MSNIPDIAAGIVFVTLAAANVVVMMEASHPSRNGITRTRLISVHRAIGYSFVMLLCIMSYRMTQRLAGLGITSHLPTHLVLHIVLVLALVPLLLLKILIARRYKQSQSSLRVLGITIFVVAFLIVSIPAFSEFLRFAGPGSIGSKVVTALVVVVCLVQCALAFKKKTQTQHSAESRISGIPAPGIPLIDSESTKASSMNLLLASTEQQTHDTRTLRFQLPKERRFCAKPGQFLTFQWMIEGQRVTRSYTISSSSPPAHYVEITPKRAENGCVSVFLNDRAKPGLRVEASGPYGSFYFDETLHENIVLIAAGSGITPMIAMLRYIDTLKLGTPVRLLYCVRTAADIIFRDELARLRTSLANFKYEVCLSRPDANWTGHTGHLTKEPVSEYVSDMKSPTFFLCGPQGFMDNTRQILSALGVQQEQILQESFGESKRALTLHPQEAQTAGTVVFIRSEKVCQVSAGNTLLDTAEQNNVQIPYGCRRGQCGTCATRVLSGTVRMEVETGLTAEQKRAGYVLPCVSRAEGTVVVVA